MAGAAVDIFMAPREIPSRRPRDVEMIRDFGGITPENVSNLPLSNSWILLDGAQVERGAA
jgi:hypothetical protein